MKQLCWGTKWYIFVFILPLSVLMLYLVCGLHFQAARARLALDRKACMFYRRAIFIFYRCQNCPLNFISCTRNICIIFRLKNNTNGPIFGFSNSFLELMTLSKVHKMWHIGILVWKLTLSSHGHVVLLLPYMTQFFNALSDYISPLQILLLTYLDQVILDITNSCNMARTNYKRWEISTKGNMV